MTTIGRRLRRGTQALALAAALSAGTVALTSAQPALATSVWTQANCGWQLVSEYVDPAKQTTVWLPQVTGLYSQYQYVTLRVQFHYQNGGDIYYDFYTTARSGQWTQSWTASSGGGTYTSVFDPIGKSGYGTGDASSANTTVYITAWWWWNNKVVGGPISQWAWNSRNSSYICNTGPNWNSVA